MYKIRVSNKATSTMLCSDCYVRTFFLTMSAGNVVNKEETTNEQRSPLYMSIMPQTARD